VGSQTTSGQSGSGDRRRRPRATERVLGGGEEPDPRFTLANERTFLAWIRTALALLAGGIAVEAFTTEVFSPEIRKTVAVLLLLLAMFIAGGACFRWLNVERAMRHKTPLPLPLIIPVLALGGALVSAVFIVFVLLRDG
jgi:putative membrane protein